MTTKKKTAVKKETKKVVKEVKQEAKKNLADVFGNFLKGFLKDVDKELHNKKIKLDKLHNYFVSYSALDEDGDRYFGQSCFSTDLNIFESTGLGMHLLAHKFEKEGCRKVVILNVIKLEETKDDNAR